MEFELGIFYWKIMTSLSRLTNIQAFKLKKW